jgi:hypothetical protein
MKNVCVSVLVLSTGRVGGIDIQTEREAKANRSISALDQQGRLRDAANICVMRGLRSEEGVLQLNAPLLNLR